MNENEEEKVINPEIEKIKVTKEFAIHQKIAEAEYSAKLDLIGLVKSRISSFKCKNELKEEAVSLLMERIKDDKENITSLTLVKLIEVLNKSETDNLSGLFNLFKPNVNLNLNSNQTYLSNEENTNLPDNGSENDLSKEEIKSMKKVMSFIRLIRDLEVDKIDS